MDRRAHHRVQLRLPARLRWTTPFGQKTEVSTTVDISRVGTLVPCHEPHAEGTSLWLTLPFDASIAYGQPEVLARVVRAVAIVHSPKEHKGNGNGNGSARHANGNGHQNGSGHHNGNSSNGHRANGNGNGHSNGNGYGNGASEKHHADGAESAATFRSPSATHAAEVVTYAESLASAAATHAAAAVEPRVVTIVALAFDAPLRRAGAHAIVRLRDVERRMSARRPFAVPLRVRTEHVPWFEETMTIDCSRDGLKFCSNREYTRGQFLVVSFESSDVSPWLGVAESLLMVVRIEREPESPVLQIAVCRSQQFSFHF